MNNTIEDYKQTLIESSQPRNLIFQWVKNDKITFKQFNTLIDFLEEENKRQKEYDYLNR